MSDPFQKFLGASATADAHRLLALTPGQRHPRAVLAALQSQLARIDNHPESQTAPAEAVRQRLYEAARALLENGESSEALPATAPGPSLPSTARASTSWMQSAASQGPSAAAGAFRGGPQRPVLETAAPPSPRAPILTAPPNRLDLTAFDRNVLAILVACGGWNAMSRAKLVELAADHNVSPQGLMKVVTGLCGHARLGATRFDVAQITQGARRFEQIPGSPAPMPGQFTSDEVAESLLPELKEGGTWATIKLSILFGAVTLLAGLLLLQVLLDDDEPAPTPIATQPAIERPIDLGPGNDNAPDEPIEPERALAQWPQSPTFRSAGSPDAAADALDQSPRLPELIDELARKLTVAEAPSAMSRQDWLVFNEQAALIWVEGDRAIVRAVRANLFDVLFALADRSTAAEEFLSALAEPAAAPIDDPLDLWRGAWAAGMLGEVANRADLPAFLRQAASLKLESILGESSENPPRTFPATARAWLAQKTPRLVELAQSSPEAETFWELWLRAHNSLGRDDGFDRALATAMAAILQTSVDLAQPCMLVNILGRLIEEANFSDSRILREEVLTYFSDAAIDNRDLWVFTSLLIEKQPAPWMSDQFLVAADATPEARRNAMIGMERAWPRAQAPAESATAGRGIAVDPALGQRWMTLARRQVAELSRISQIIDNRGQELLSMTVLAAWLNEAALALAQGNQGEAEQAMRRVEAGWNSAIPAQAREQQQQPMPPGGPIQRPGGTNQPTLPNIPGTPGNIPPDAPRPSAPGLPLDPGGMPQNPPAPGGGAPTGRANGPDGNWAAAYNAAERNVDERMELLRSLRATSGGDLGPIDARRIVEEAYRGPIPELRLFAQTILTELFTRGPNVARELVDQFTDAPAREITTTFLSSFLSRTLPSPQSSSWRQEARVALLEHALRLLPFPELEIDQLAEALAESYADGVRLLRPESAGGQSWPLPAEAIEAQVNEWRALAEKRMVSDPVPDSLAAIERRHATRLALAQGPIERAVAAQITILEVLTYISVGEQPVLAGEARSLLDRAASERIESDHILEQLLRTELAITQVWMLRLEIAEEEVISDE